MVRRILVVDDDPAFRSLAARILTSWQHDVVGEAGSVSEALARAVELRPDAVLADIGLPDGNGFDLAQQLSDMPWGPVVVLISSDADSANALAATRAGASGFWPKDELPSPSLRQLLADR